MSTCWYENNYNFVKALDSDISIVAHKQLKISAKQNQAAKTNRRVANACNFCKKLHLRCDGERDCANCNKRQLQCVYKVNRKRGPKEKIRSGVLPNKPPNNNNNPSSLISRASPDKDDDDVDEGYELTLDQTQTHKSPQDSVDLKQEQSSSPPSWQSAPTPVHSAPLENLDSQAPVPVPLENQSCDTIVNISTQTKRKLGDITIISQHTEEDDDNLGIKKTKSHNNLANSLAVICHDSAKEYSIPPHISHLSNLKFPLRTSSNPFAHLYSSGNTAPKPPRSQEANENLLIDDPKELSNFVNAFYTSFGYLYYWLSRKSYRQQVDILLGSSKGKVYWTLSFIGILANGSRVFGHKTLSDIYFEEGIRLYQIQQQHLVKMTFTETSDSSDRSRLYDMMIDIAMGLQLLGHYQFSIGQMNKAANLYQHTNHLLEQLLERYSCVLNSQYTYNDIYSLFRHNISDLILTTQSRESRVQLYSNLTSPENRIEPVNGEESAENLYSHMAFAVGELVFTNDQDWPDTPSNSYLSYALCEAETSLNSCQASGGDQSEWGLLEMRHLLVLTLRAGAHYRNGSFQIASSCADRASAIVSSLIAHRLLRLVGTGAFLALNVLFKIHSLTNNISGLQTIMPGLILAREYFPLSIVEPMLKSVEKLVQPSSSSSTAPKITLPSSQPLNPPVIIPNSISNKNVIVVKRPEELTKPIPNKLNVIKEVMNIKSETRPEHSLCREFDSSSSSSSSSTAVVSNCIENRKLSNFYHHQQHQQHQHHVPDGFGYVDSPMLQYQYPPANYNSHNNSNNNNYNNNFYYNNPSAYFEDTWHLIDPSPLLCHYGFSSYVDEPLFDNELFELSQP
jgi:hypothetical protein